MKVPELTEEQRIAARAAAAASRRARADLKARLAAGEMTLAQALDEAQRDHVLAGVPVVALLKALPKVGQKRAMAAMERHEIAANRRIRGLGHRQVAGLVEDFS